MFCKICKKDSGNKNFCSSSCAVKHRNIVNPQPKKSLNKCAQCNKETKNPKFCNTTCSALFHNHKKEYFCGGCNILMNIGWVNNNKFCNKCKIDSSININYKDWSKVTIEEHFGKLKTYQAHARIRALARAKFLKEKPNIKSCEHCGYNKHFEICHKKSISSFDKSSTSIATVNNINNLIALCPNCHYEFDNVLKDEKFLPLPLTF